MWADKCDTTAMSTEERDAKGMGCVSITISIFLAVLFAINLRFGLESALVSHEGILVGASLLCVDNGGECLYYYIHEYVEYANHTGHCTVANLDSFSDRYYAEIAFSKIELNITQTIWLEPGHPQACYDGEIIQDNFNNAMTWLMCSFLLFALGSCCCWASFLYSTSEQAYVPLRTDEEQGSPPPWLRDTPFPQLLPTL